jgi:hypothetical protein
MSRSFEDYEITARLFGEGGATADRGNCVVCAVDDEHGTGDTTAERARLLRRHSRPVLRGGHRLAVRLERPSDRILDLLRRMRLREHLRHEELDPIAVVAQPVEPVVLRPAFVRVVFSVEVVDGPLGQRLAAA